MTYEQANRALESQIDNVIDGNPVDPVALEVAKLLNYHTDATVDLASLTATLTGAGIDLAAKASENTEVLQFMLVGRKLANAIGASASGAGRRDMVRGKYANLLNQLENYL